MTIRQARQADIPEIIKVERRAWPKGGAATSEQFNSRIATFPAGVMVAVIDSRVAGVVAGEIISSNYLENDNISWSGITDDGYIRRSHNPVGDALFGVDLSVDPEYRNAGVGKALLLEIGKMAIRRNLKMGILGARMPDYHKYSKDVKPESYIRLRNRDGRLVDSELRFYEKSGLKLVKVVPHYFPDKDSLDYGVLAVWKNPFYVRSKSVGMVIGFVGALIFKI